MARMRYKSDPAPASLHRAARHMPARDDPADPTVVIAPAPIEVLWSLHTYPFPDPERVAEAAAEQEPEPGSPCRHRTRGGRPA